MSFEKLDSARVYWKVGLETYITLLEGETGTLKYKVDGSSTKFEGFVRD